eukprot:249184_1
MFCIIKSNCSRCSKSLYQLAKIITSFRTALFGENGRIPLGKLRQSKHFNFSKCVNIFNLISFIINNLNDEKLILKEGNDILAIVHKSFRHAAPELFTCGINLVIKHFEEWKLIIRHHLISKHGLLSILLKKKDMRNKAKRKIILQFRSTASKDRSIQMKTHAYWNVANCAKSMPVTETLVENVVAVSNDVIIQKASELFEKEIGSHVLMDKNAKSKHKVLKRVKNQKKEGPFAVPVTFENDDQ